MAAIKVNEIIKVYPVIKGYRELILHPFRKKGVNALNGVSLEVKQGECLCLLGPNGAGKTTLIKILTTLVLPDGGQAWVNGYNVTKDPAKVKNSVGYAISDERSFYWRLTGRQNLNFFAALNGLFLEKRRKMIQDVLELTDLGDAADLRFNTYSTGMRQMLVFARALLSNPAILFVDEPTRSLDPQAAHRVRQFIRKELVDKQGKTVFWATHNLSEAEEYSHKIAVINKGRIKAWGTMGDLSQNGQISLQEVFDRAVKEESK